MKVFQEGLDPSMHRFWREEGFTLTGNLFSADLLCLEGGADVTPAIYGHENTASACNPSKDYTSFGLIHLAHNHLNIPVVGVCRGSQVMNVYHGGVMKQHIDGHAGYPHMVEWKGKNYTCTSAHHQESVPCFRHPEEDILRAPDGVVEAMIYRESRMMGFQPHPEYTGVGHSCRQLFFLLLSEIVDIRPNSLA